MQFQTPQQQDERTNHLLITKSLPAKVDANLVPEERTVLAMIDGFASHAGAVAWGCDYDHLIKLASITPAIDDDKIISTLSRLREFKALDYSLVRDGTKLEIWVSRWMHRASLAHAIVDQLIARRSSAAA